MFGMTLYYRESDLAGLIEAFRKAISESDRLLLEFYHYKYHSEVGREHGLQGFSRRLRNLCFSLELVFEMLPPESPSIPAKRERKIAEMAIQSFVLGIFGACDNLAWLLVNELKIKKDDGSDVPRKSVGLRSKVVRQNLPIDFVKFLESRDDWFVNLGEFRDTLAHRIPLYIAPFVVRTSDAQEYHQLEDKIWIAIAEGNDSLQAELEGERDRLQFFRPWISHSFGEASPQLVIHPQMVSDLMTINEFGSKTHELLISKQER